MGNDIETSEILLFALCFYCSILCYKNSYIPLSTNNVFVKL